MLDGKLTEAIKADYFLGIWHIPIKSVRLSKENDDAADTGNKKATAYSIRKPLLMMEDKKGHCNHNAF